MPAVLLDCIMPLTRIEKLLAALTTVANVPCLGLSYTYSTSHSYECTPTRLHYIVY
jgi:hypothetical protein